MKEELIHQTGEQESSSSVQKNRLSILIENKGRVIIASCVVLVLAIVGVYFYNNNQTQKESEASLALSRIRSYVEAGEFEKALSGDPVKKVRGNEIIGLRLLVDEYSSTESGKSAALLAGNAEFSLRKFDEAARYFDISKNSSSAMIRLQSFAGIGACYELQSKYEDAVNSYEHAIEISANSGLRDKLLLCTAQCYQKLGNSEKASKCLRDLIGEFEYSEYLADAKSILSKLGTVVE